MKGIRGGPKKWAFIRRIKKGEAFQWPKLEILRSFLPILPMVGRRLPGHLLPPQRNIGSLAVSSRGNLPMGLIRYEVN
jgi:hypothetical protein